MDTWLIDKFKSLHNRNAIIYDDKLYTYKDLLDEIFAFSNFINKYNIKPGEVVAIINPFSFRSIALFLALSINKNIILTIASKAIDEIEERLELSHADWQIEDIDCNVRFKRINFSEKPPLILNLTNQDNAGLIIFSSGSTGQKKCMLHNLDTMIESYRKSNTKEINTMLFMDFDHIGGLDTLFRQLSIGATLTIPKSRDVDEVCSLIEKHKVDVLPVTPSFLNLIIISEAYKRWDISSLKIIAYGAEPMSEATFKKTKEIFPGIQFQQKFGTSETGALKIISKSSDSLFFKFQESTVYKIIENELWLKGNNRVLGYLNSPLNQFSDDGWFKTGDIVENTEDGYMRIVGRKTEIINVGGQKVFPLEVESIILKMPKIGDCSVYGEKNLITGQIVVADVLVDENKYDTRQIRKELREFLTGKLDDYKIPIKIHIVNKLKYTSTFKKQRRED